jgi:hypothetical protein
MVEACITHELGISIGILEPDGHLHATVTTHANDCDIKASGTQEWSLAIHGHLIPLLTPELLQ